jgi:hypothetical protein
LKLYYSSDVVNSPEIDIAVLRVSLGVGVEIDSLGASLFVCLAVSFCFPPVLEDGLVLESLCKGGVTTVVLAPGPPRQRAWVNEGPATLVLLSVVCVEWQCKGAVLVNGYQESVCLLCFISM